MARDNPRWGSEHIRSELLKLGLVVSKPSIQRYRRRGPAHPSSRTWRTLLTNHAHHLWAADLLTVQTLTFKTLYVLVFHLTGPDSRERDVRIMWRTLRRAHERGCRRIGVGHFLQISQLPALSASFFR